jgi:hypothetical protein
MRKSIIDITGCTFGKLVVISYSHSDKHKRPMWNCICECGNKCIAPSPCLRKGNKKHCGCMSIINRSIGLRRHGGCIDYKEAPLYKLWRGIKRRCSSPHHASYRNYGARGISIYPEWEKDYSKFESYILDTIGAMPKGKSLDRIDSNKDYVPGNLRWATRIEQNLNRCKLRTRPTTSKYKGVCFIPRIQRWHAQIGKDYKNINLGYYLTETEAAIAYNEGALIHHGANAQLNAIV